MSTMPPDPRTIDDLLAKARTRNRNADYDVTAAEARLRSRHAARHRPPRQRTAETALAHTAWPPAYDRTPDADAPGGLTAVSLLVLFGPNADRHLDDFIDSQYADKTGALVFACLLHLAGNSSGARFWWRFAAGVGHLVAEYCLWLRRCVPRGVRSSPPGRPGDGHRPAPGAPRPARCRSRRSRPAPAPS
ncbi:hypothetical protein [Streptomyces sp. NPDC048825]|uniref:hypothetical protein n=1 Tax=Streptomyces sp. NPDC048825 TaxID=3365592 RepID=UPI003720EA1D